jgi:DNA-binding FrmR family transcriptional regulator
MEYTPSMFNRLRRIEGQIRGVLAMMENGRDCRDVVTQLSAIRSAVDKAIATIVVANLETCLRQELTTEGNTEHTVKQAVELLLKSR